MLSNNYYSSTACLNEMGASWILQSEYYSILMPDFNFNEIKGAINPNKIAIKLDGADIKPSLNDLKDRLCLKFNTSISVNKWERSKDSFINNISEEMKNKKLNIGTDSGIVSVFNGNASDFLYSQSFEN